MNKIYRFESSIGFINIDLALIVGAIFGKNLGTNSVKIFSAGGVASRLPCKNKRESKKKLQELLEVIKRYEKSVNE